MLQTIYSYSASANEAAKPDLNQLISSKTSEKSSIHSSIHVSSKERDIGSVIHERYFSRQLHRYSSDDTNTTVPVEAGGKSIENITTEPLATEAQADLVEVSPQNSENRVEERQSQPQTSSTQATSVTHQFLSQSDIDGVQLFLMFIGWPRSCHSIIGSMLDAHPNMIVAHEYFLFDKMVQNEQLSLNRTRLFSRMYRNSYNSIQQKGWRNLNNNKKGYSLNINGSWQGKFSHLKVIGDKSGGRTVMEYIENSAKFRRLYRQLVDSVGVPIRMLHIVRNPLDMIATAALYSGSTESGKKARATPTKRYRNNLVLKQSVSDVVSIARGIMRMVPDVGLSPLEVHCEDLIADPAKTISHICQFLDVECSADYLQMCVDNTFKNVSESRHLVNWDPHTLPLLIDTLRTFPFFNRYNLTTEQV